MRRVVRRLVVAGSLVTFAVLSGPLSGATQQSGLSGAPGSAAPHSDPGGFGRPDAAQVNMQERQAKSRNEERQKKLVEDTAKLFALASELKDEVAKSNKDTMSLDVIKKADEIEHLAHSVKEKMKG